MKSLAVTIGIPAYNEEANIAFLLEDILKQRQETFQLKKILVISCLLYTSRDTFDILLWYLGKY